MGEAADKRGGVEVLHDGDAEFGHGWIWLAGLIIAKQKRRLAAKFDFQLIVSRVAEGHLQGICERNFFVGKQDHEDRGIVY